MIKPEVPLCFFFPLSAYCIEGRPAMLDLSCSGGSLSLAGEGCLSTQKQGSASFYQVALWN